MAKKNSERNFMATEQNNHMKLAELESWLFEAANMLRGPIDNADFKTYIFPLLFYKRICDVYDEEFNEALLDADGDIEEATFRENFRFVIPPDCHWNVIRQKTENLGQTLANGMRCIEKENQEVLYQIFGDAQWGNKERLPDALLIELIDHFSKKNLSNRNVDPDVAGQAYEYLIKKFADMSNKKAGEYYTPRSVIRLMTKILKPESSDSVYDPACGTGGMLLEAFNYVYSHKGDIRLLRLFGQEKNLTTSSIARMNLILHGLEDFQIIRGDTLRQPKFIEADSLATFDVVIANPPFSLKKWGEDLWVNDPFKRNFGGVPPENYGDYAWVQHMISSMAKPRGRTAVVLPQGALFRKGSEGKIRQKIIDMDLLEAVIELGGNLFYGATLAACILVFRQTKECERKNKVLFIDASAEYKSGRKQNELLDSHVEKIFSLYESYSNIEGISNVASLEEIRGEDYNLTISLYVKPVVKEDSITAREAISNLKRAADELVVAEDKFKKLLSEMEGI
jgi:type I restriction enzyme M protein